MNSANIIQLVSVAGIGGIIGSLITTTLQAWFAARSSLTTRSFQERKEAYIGFLEALHRSEIEGTREAAHHAGYWQNRCELVAPAQVRNLISEIFRTNPTDGHSHPERPKIVSSLKEAMRSGLGVAAS